MTKQESASDELAALTARLAEAEADADEARTVTRQADQAARDLGARLVAVERERDSLRRELAEMDDVAGHVAAERDDADAERVAQDGRWRALVGALAEAAVSVCTLLEPASMMHDACDGIEGHFSDLCRGCIAEGAYQVTQAALWVAQAALADAPPAPREPSA